MTSWSSTRTEGRLPSPIAVLGAATSVGTALINGIVSTSKETRIFAVAPNLASMAHLPASVIDRGTRDIEAVSNAAVVIIAAEYWPVKFLLQNIVESLSKRRSVPVVISAVDGLSVECLERALHEQIRIRYGGQWGDSGRLQVVRFITNPPCIVGAACTLICSRRGLGGETMKLTELIMACIGTVQPLEEKYVDVAKSITGCGVAYMLMAIEAMADAGVRHGLKREVAQHLAAATVEGAGKFVRVNPELHPAVLRNRMEIPGGVTLAATAQLDNDGFRAAIGNAMDVVMGHLKEK